MKKLKNNRGFTPTPKLGVTCRRQGGFTLMEVIIAIGIITTALVVSVALITFSLSGIRGGKSKIIAAGLAQEGIEIVRNIRDSNWISGKRSPSNWRDDLGAGYWRVQYNQASLLSFSNTPLKIDSNGFYQYNSGSTTKFYRRIGIEYIGNNQIKVVSEVTWQEQGRNQNLQLEDRLYNWLEE